MITIMKKTGISLTTLLFLVSCVTINISLQICPLEPEQLLLLRRVRARLVPLVHVRAATNTCIAGGRLFMTDAAASIAAVIERKLSRRFDKNL